MCTLEPMRLDPANVDAKGRRLLGDWPIEIDLWVEAIQQQGLPESIKDLCARLISAGAAVYNRLDFAGKESVCGCGEGSGLRASRDPAGPRA
jgi:hypothetical protein